MLLRGDLLCKWTATYQPVWNGWNNDDLEREKEVVKGLSEWAKKEELHLIGGDFNAHVGGGEDRPGVCGQFGLRESNHRV